MPKPLRVLIVEDSEDDAFLLVRHLHSGGYAVTFERVEEAEAMRAALQKQPWDVVLSDHQMPRFNAPAALQLLKEKWLDIPFIIISGTIGEEAAAALMKAGAHDFVSKGKLPRLLPIIERELREAARRREHRRELAVNELLYEVDRRILQGEELERILPMICGRLADILAYPLVWIGMKEKDGGVSICSHLETIAECLRGLGMHWDETPQGQWPLGRVIRTGEIQVVRMGDEPLPPCLETACEGRLRMVIALPLSAKQQVVGGLVVGFAKEEFGDEDRRHLRDVTARISAVLERAFDQRQLRLHGTALASAANAVFITDAEGRIEWTNASFTRISGYSLEEVRGQTPRILKSGKQDLAYYQKLWRTILAGEVWQSETTNRRKDGTLFIVDQTITPLRDAQGNIAHFVAIQEDVTARKEAEARIEFLSHHDALTGLPNRSFLESHLSRALVDAWRGERLLAFLILDLDRFQQVTDTLGYAVGDSCLTIIAERLRAVVRACDFVARIGSDVFAVVAGGLKTIDDSAALARKLLEALAKPCCLLNGQELRFSAGIGITIFPNDGAEAEELLKNADLALHAAKLAGGNNYRYFSAEMNARLQERTALERDLHKALERDEILLHYQPQLDLIGGTVVGVEALARWQHPERGWVPASQFIGVAEESGLIVPLGERVLRQACRQSEAWHAVGLLPQSVAVNVSAIQFKREKMDALVASILQEIGMKPEHLELEVTETMLMEDVDAAAEIMQRLHALGVRLAIDDFGIGHSSLNYLRRFPVQKLKIDQSFMRDVEVRPDTAVIVRTIIGLAHNLGLRVIAEGVETQTQIDFLRREGCDEIQGYYYCRPMPPENVAAFLRGEKVLSAEC